MSTIPDASESSKTVNVRFLTNEDEYRVTDKPFSVPAILKRLGLSQVINHLLKTEKPIPFDFIIDNEFLRTSLGEFLQTKGKSDEEIVTIWYERARHELQTEGSLPHPDWVSALDHRVYVADSSDVVLLSGAYDGVVRLWEVRDTASPDNNTALSRPALELRAHARPIKALCSHAFSSSSPSSRSPTLRFASVGLDHHVLLWTLVRLREASPTSDSWSAQPLVKLTGHSAAVESVDFHPDGQLLVTGGWDSTLKIWDLRATADITQSNDRPQATEAPSTKRRRVDEQQDSLECRCMLTLSGHKGPVSQVHWIDGEANLVVSGSLDVSIRVWDVGSGLNTYTAHSSAPIRSLDLLSASFNPNSNSTSSSLLLITAHTDRILRVWDLRVPSSSTSSVFTLTPTHSFVAPKAWCANVCWLPHTNVPLFAATDYAGTLRVWDLRSSVPLASLLHVHSPAAATTPNTHTTTDNNNNNSNTDFTSPSVRKAEKILSLTAWWTQSGGTHLATGGTDNRLIVHLLSFSSGSFFGASLLVSLSLISPSLALFFLACFLLCCSFLYSSKAFLSFSLNSLNSSSSNAPKM